MEPNEKKHTASSQVAEFITSSIISGKFTAGNRLPPLRQLAKMTGVSGYPVQEAIAQLKELGVVDTIIGSGVYVSEDAIRILSANLPKIPKYRNIAIISAFLFHDGGVVIEHNATVRGLFEESKEQLIRPCLISPFLDLEDKDEVVNELVCGKFDGVLWLYPTLKHTKSVKAISNAGIPIVITSHESIGLDVPTVEENMYDAAKKIRKIFEANGCKKTIFFDLETATTTTFPKIYNNYDSGIDVEIVKIPYSGDHYRIELRKRLTPDISDYGIFLINNRDFRAFLSDSEHELLEMLKNHTVIFACEEAVFETLSPLWGKLNMSVVLHSFSGIGRLAIQKLSVVMEGKLDKTTTLVPLELVNAKEDYSTKGLK